MKDLRILFELPDEKEFIKGRTFALSSMKDMMEFTLPEGWNIKLGCLDLDGKYDFNSLYIQNKFYLDRGAAFIISVIQPNWFEAQELYGKLHYDQAEKRITIDQLAGKRY